MDAILKSTITQTFLERVKTDPFYLGFQFKPTYPEMGPVGQWTEMSYQKFFLECRMISFGLERLGIRPGDKVAILSNTRIEWSMTDMAILGAKTVTVPIYASNTPEDIAYIFN